MRRFCAVLLVLLASPALGQDVTAPSAISDLAASNAQWNSITLSWTAPGDDAGTGRAASYDVRYSTSEITEGNWASATQVSLNEPHPLTAGKMQSMDVVLPSVSTTYYFAIKTSDEAPNESALSNVPSLATTADITKTNVSACGTLSSADTYYVLTQNLDSTGSGTCITIAASNVTLDLNGYTITYGYDFDLANPGFETDTTGWTFSDATNMTRVSLASENYVMSQDYALKIAEPGGGWADMTATSDWVTIPTGVNIAATWIRAFDPGQDGQLRVTVAIERNNGPTTLASVTDSTSASYLTATTAATDEYRVVVTYPNPDGYAHTNAWPHLYLDEVHLLADGSAGNVHGVTTNFNLTGLTIKNGTIQTAGPMVRSGCISTRASSTTVRNIRAIQEGVHMDVAGTSAISVQGKGDADTGVNLITRCTADTQAVLFDTNRETREGGIAMSGANSTGGGEISYNTIEGGYGSVGITSIDVMDADITSIKNNYIHGRTAITNHELLDPPEGAVTVEYNDIVADFGSGMYVHTGNTVRYNNVEINGWEPNHEFFGLSADGIRSNDYNNWGTTVAAGASSTYPPDGVWSNLTISNNTVTVTATRTARFSSYTMQQYPVSTTVQPNFNANGILVNASGTGNIVSGNSITVNVTDSYMCGSVVTAAGGIHPSIGGASSTFKWCASGVKANTYYLADQSTTCGSAFVAPKMDTAQYYNQVPDAVTQWSSNKETALTKIDGSGAFSSGEWAWGNWDTLTRTATVTSIAKVSGTTYQANFQTSPQTPHGAVTGDTMTFSGTTSFNRAYTVTRIGNFAVTFTHINSTDANETGLTAVSTMDTNTVYARLIGDADPDAALAGDLIQWYGGDVTYSGNTFTTNGVFAHLMGYGNGNAGTKFLGNTWTKTGEAGVCTAAGTVAAGADQNVSGGSCDVSGRYTSSQIRGTQFIGETETAGAATADVHELYKYAGFPRFAYDIGWYLDLTIEDVLGTPVEGASVSAVDATAAASYSGGSTDANGQDLDVPLLEEQNYGTQATTYTTTYNPHTLTVSKTGYETRTYDVSLTANASLTLDLVPSTALLYSTLDDAAAVTSPEIGTGGTVVGTPTFEAGHYGAAAKMDADTDQVSFPVADVETSDTGADGGQVSWWMRFDADPATYNGGNVEWVAYFADSGGNLQEPFSLEYIGTVAYLDFIVYGADGGGDLNVHTSGWSTWTNWKTNWSGAWHKVTLRWTTEDAGTTYTYEILIDDTNAGCANCSKTGGPFTQDTAATWRLGGTGATRWLPLSFDDVVSLGSATAGEAQPPAGGGSTTHAAGAGSVTHTAGAGSVTYQ